MLRPEIAAAEGTMVRSAGCPVPRAIHWFNPLYEPP